MSVKHSSTPEPDSLRAPALSVLIVNFNSWPDVSTLATELVKSTGFREKRAELVVVDNASTDPPPEELTKLGHGVKLALQTDNGGFSAGINAGWRAASGRWLLLLNPDVTAGTELIDTLLTKIRDLESHGSKAPGIVGFALQNPDGSPQASVGAEPGLLRTLIEPFIPRSRRKYKPAHKVVAGPVPWVTGACALVDRKILETLGGMDENFFLYYEEVALCRSTRALGRSVEYDPTIQVIHLRPLQNRSISPLMRVVTRHSRLVFFRNYQPAWEFRSMVWLTRLEATLRAAWSAIKNRPDETHAWQAIQALAVTMGQGQQINGRTARDLAYQSQAQKPVVTIPQNRGPHLKPRSHSLRLQERSQDPSSTQESRSRSN